jgi:hypothetical protein
MFAVLGEDGDNLKVETNQFFGLFLRISLLESCWFHPLDIKTAILVHRPFKIPI